MALKATALNCTLKYITVVGNEDGAHHVTAELCQALADVGFTSRPMP